MGKQYDKTYCDSVKRFKDPQCKHEHTVVRDMRWKGEAPDKAQEVCVDCGLIVGWVKVEPYPGGPDHERP